MTNICLFLLDCGWMKVVGSVKVAGAVSFRMQDKHTQGPCIRSQVQVNWVKQKRCERIGKDELEVKRGH